MIEVVALGLEVAARLGARAARSVSARALASIRWSVRRERRSASASRPFSSTPTYFLAMSCEAAATAAAAPPRAAPPGRRARTAAGACRRSSRRSAGRPGSSFGTFTSVKKVSQNGRGAGDQLDRPRLDARLVHVDQQEGDALVLLGLRVGAHQAEAPVGVLRAGGPDLLAVDQPVVALVLALGLQAGEVGAGAGLGVALAPAQLAADDRRQVLGFCSSVPYSSSVGPNMLTPMPPIGL